MGNGLEVRDKKVIYMNDHQLIADAFDYVYKFAGHLIAYNSNHLVIVSPNGDLLLSEEVKISQVFNYGEYVSVRRNDAMGVYRYDATLVVPFKLSISTITYCLINNSYSNFTNKL